MRLYNCNFEHLEKYYDNLLFAQNISILILYSECTSCWILCIAYCSRSSNTITNVSVTGFYYIDDTCPAQTNMASMFTAQSISTERLSVVMNETTIVLQKLNSFE